MKRPHQILFVAFAACVALTAHLAAQTPAQNPPTTGAALPKLSDAGTAPVAKSGAADKGAVQPRDQRIDVEFDGLRLDQAMEIIRKQVPDLNIVVPPRLSDTPIGQLKLRNVTIDGLVRAISAATDDQIEGVFDQDAYLTFNSRDNAPQQQSVCRVLSLRQYLSGKKDEEVDRAIRDLNEVVEMARIHLEKSRPGMQMKAPEFSVHRATKLLIVVGSPEAVSIVDEVVSAVSNGSAGQAAGGGFDSSGFGGGAAPFGPNGFSGFGGPGGFGSGGNNPAAPQGIPQRQPKGPRGVGGAPPSAAPGEKP